MINLQLAKQRGLTDEDIFNIELLHDKRDKYIDQLKEGRIDRVYIGMMLEILEARLQELWRSALRWTMRTTYVPDQFTALPVRCTDTM
ncbi:MAG: hypothetical protein Unbinned6805contig1000_8 [Prokaryotic dsDNA virus sp.]|nr:MAG: hypothetical protein Unbinned6805contig1000_8 [Prokaryotic dsDNA virus sp.]|tara:strand:- start:18391 stop:18654 length:264 start_codon:yes stop_codon:yes gene_type:complete